MNHGTYKATFKWARYWESSDKKTPMVQIRFLIENIDEEVTWQGWINNPKNLENTMKRMIEALHFTGDDSTDENGFFKNEAFPQKEVSIVVEVENFIGKDGTSKIQPRVKWLNALDKFETIEPEVVKSKLGSIGFKAGFHSAKQLVGTKTKPTTPVTTETELF